MKCQSKLDTLFLTREIYYNTIWSSDIQVDIHFSNCYRFIISINNSFISFNYIQSNISNFTNLESTCFLMKTSWNGTPRSILEQRILCFKCQMLWIIYSIRIYLSLASQSIDDIRLLFANIVFIYKLTNGSFLSDHHQWIVTGFFGICIPFHLY